MNEDEREIVTLHESIERLLKQHNDGEMLSPKAYDRINAYFNKMYHAGFIMSWEGDRVVYTPRPHPESEVGSDYVPNG